MIDDPCLSTLKMFNVNGPTTPKSHEMFKCFPYIGIAILFLQNWQIKQKTQTFIFQNLIFPCDFKSILD
jgi:hypothetical protein